MPFVGGPQTTHTRTDTTTILQVSELSAWARERADAAAVLRAAAAAEAAGQQLLASLAADAAAAQERLRDLLRLIEDTTAQVCL
jgi:hypothetical protein